jgi:tetratricopeptide (TPR) repeat protein/predicted Ser/Thr protein kinase
VRIGGYELLGELGRGGMSVVYRARADGREVAVKVLTRGTDEPLMEREVRLLSSLSEADGFVPILDTGSDARTRFIVMPLLAGGTLRDRLRNGPLAPREAAALVARLARAMGRAHERGIVHRDLKPENVLFGPKGVPFVADLGLAKHFRRDVLGASATRSETARGMAGTVGYMAPELLDDASSAGPRADVFALGAILHESIAGARPFEETGILGYASALKTRHALPLRRLRGDVPRWLEAVVTRALERAPEARYADGHALARALETGAAAPRWVIRVAAFAAVPLVGVAAFLALQGTRTTGPQAPGASPANDALEREIREEERLGDQAVASLRQGEDPGLNDAAIAHFSKLATLAPGRAVGHRKLARALAVVGSTDQAIAEATKALAIDPRDARALATRALAGSAPQALLDSERSLEIDPRLPDAWFVHGFHKRLRGDLEGALQDLDRCLALDPGHELALGMHADVRARLTDFDEAIVEATHALALVKGNVTALRVRAFARQQIGDGEGAMRDIEEALETDPTGRGAPSLRSNLALLEGLSRDSTPAAFHEELLALSAQRAARHEDRVKHAARFAELAPRLPRAHCEHAEALCLVGRFEEAIAATTSAIALAPDDGAVLATRALARCRSDPGGALEDADRSIALTPVAGYLARARIHMVQKNVAAALADFDRSLELEPSDPAALLERAALRGDAKDLDGANADLSRVLDLWPGNVEAYRVRALVRGWGGDLKGQRLDQGLLDRLLQQPGAPGR